MDQAKSIKKFIKEFVSNFTFSSRSEKDEFEQQANQDMELIVNDAEVDIDIDDDIDDIIIKDKVINPLENLNSSQISLNNGFNLDPVKDAQNEFKRLAILDHIEEEFFKTVNCRIEKQFINVGLPPIRIWTITAFPDDKDFTTNSPIVCLHGFGSGVAQWTKLVDTLTEKRVCYLIDIPGFGKSSRPSFNSDGTLNLAALVDFIDQWRRAVGLMEPFILMGHSFGCYVASAFSLRHPDLVRNIILLDPWGIYDLNSDYTLTKTQFEQNYKLYCRIGEALASFLSPLELMRKTGLVGKYLLKTVKKSLHNNFADVVDINLFFDYWFYCNSGKPTGEYLYKSLQTNLFFAKVPLINYFHQLPQHITVRLIVGENGFVNRLNQNVDKQLLSVLGSERFKSHMILGHDHQFYANNEFINILKKISLTGLIDEK